MCALSSLIHSFFDSTSLFIIPWIGILKSGGNGADGNCETRGAVSLSPSVSRRFRPGAAHGAPVARRALGVAPGPHGPVSLASRGARRASFGLVAYGVAAAWAKEPRVLA